MPAAQNEFTYRNRYFFVTDIILFILSAYLSFALRLEAIIFEDVIPGLLCFILISLGVKLVVFTLGGVYSRYWKNAGPSELLLLAAACLTAGALTSALTILITTLTTYDQIPLPRSIAIIDFLLSTLLVITTRFSLRARFHLVSNYRHRRHTS